MKRFFVLFLVLLCVAWSSLASAQGIIQTVAGSRWSFRGNGGLAVAAPLGRSYGIAADPRATDGTIYVADYDNNIVVKVQGGKIFVVAGNTLCCISGDGGLATAASIDSPYGVAMDSAGNLYISQVNRIRKVTPSGIISTYAGNGVYTFAGDGGPATSASFRTPRGLAVDSNGNLYIADGANHCVRKVTPGGLITTVAGVGGQSGFSGDGGPATAALLNFPYNVAVDNGGNLFISDLSNQRIRKVNASGIISTYAGNGNYDSTANAIAGDGGPALSSPLGDPYGLAVDPSGNLFIADRGHQRIRKVTPSGIISSIANNNGFFVDFVFGLAMDPINQLHVSLEFLEEIQKVDPAGIAKPVLEAGNANYKYSGDNGPATTANLNTPNYAIPDGTGLLIADTNNFLLRSVDSSGTIRQIAGSGLNFFDTSSQAATQVSLTGGVRGMVRDPRTGNLYVSITGMVRQITTGGISSPVAGSLVNGSYGPAGNGVAAVGVPGAGMQPRGLAIDSSSNIYVADFNNDCVRKFTVGGNITTYAGTCNNSGYSGDGGPATAAKMNGPWGLAFDTAGNLYIAEYVNDVVRKVTPNGIITTVAGNNKTGYSGDGGQATLAMLDTPHNAWPDNFGNLYIADSNNNRIRKVDASGVITTVAGDGSFAFRGDGGPATSASLAYPEAVVLDSAGNMYITDTDNDRIRAVVISVPSFTASATSLTFTALAGQTGTTTSAIALGSSLSGLSWSATVSSNATWLKLSQSAGRIPASVTVGVDATSLAAGSYSGTITLAAPGASPSQITVNVSLTVSAPQPPKLAVERTAITFQGISNNPAPAPANLRILNSGGSSLNWSVQATTFSGGSWLSVSPSAGTATPGSPGVALVSVSTALAPGTYSGTLTVTSSTTGQTFTVAVSLLVKAGQTLLLSQTGLTFVGLESGGTVPSQTFGVLNVGIGTMNWTAAVVGSCPWLTLSTTNGSSVAGATDVAKEEVSADSTTLTAGQYTCQIKVDVPSGANNAPRLVTVLFNVLPKGSILPPLIRPTGLIFVRPANSTSPGSQSVRLASGTPGGVEARLSASTFDGVNWLATAQTAVSIAPRSPADVVVQPTLGTLGVGQYFGTIDVKLRDTSTGTFSSQTIDVLFVVTPDRSGLTAAMRRPGEADTTCTPSQLYLKFRTLGATVSVPVGYPVTLETQIKDDCDNQVSNATTIASFSTGDPPVALVHVGGGVYQASWRPNGSTSQIAVTVQANSGSISGSVKTTMQASSSNTVAAIASGGVVNAASYASSSLAPGSIISVFGSNLGTGVGVPSATPLPTSLGGVTINIGGINAPLFYTSSGQVNAQIPFEITPGTPQTYALVNRSGQNVFTDSETITVIPAMPGIFSTDSSGKGQGAIQIANTAIFAAPTGSIPGVQARPAVKGVDYLTIYCNGLGAVTNPPATGAAASGSLLSSTVIVPTVTIGGVAATPTFSGLSPGFVGLYQVNVQVPAGTQSGAAIPVVVTMNGVASNTVTIAVQ